MFMNNVAHSWLMLVIAVLGRWMEGYTMKREPELLDIKQAAALLQVSEASLRRWTNDGRLASYRVGGRRERRFRRADLLAFLESGPNVKLPRAGEVGGQAAARHLCGLYTNDLGR